MLNTLTYRTPDPWALFTESHPVICRVPILRHWAFGVFTQTYFQHLMPHTD